MNTLQTFVGTLFTPPAPVPGLDQRWNSPTLQHHRSTGLDGTITERVRLDDRSPWVNVTYWAPAVVKGAAA